MLIQATTQTTQGHVYILSGNDDLNIADGVVITSTDTDAVTTWIGQHTVTVSGSIFGFDECLNFIGTLDAQTVVIEATGKLVSGYLPGVVDSDGIILDGINSSIVNHGSITSHGSALSLFVHDGGTTTITNTGTMTAEKYGIWNKFGAGILNVTNSGTIESPTISYFGGNFVDNLTNSGLMKGAVNLGSGNDSYVGTAGRVVGIISGDAGDDIFAPGKYADTINGGDGIDTVDFSASTTAITVDLTNANLNRGTLALGDSYTSIENLIGGKLNDKLTGDAADNLLSGGLGADTLSGGLGNDTLIGGGGRNRLTGGDGADTFVFTAPSASNLYTSLFGNGDIITDFNATADHIRLSGAAFGYGTYKGAVDANDFVVAGNNRALDATDHFIFRTTDATLWFDADGKGGTGPVLIADLNNGVLLNASHLEII